MDISPKHAAAVVAACRIPALAARLELLIQPTPANPARARFEFYATTKPTPGAPPGGDPIATLPMTASVGTIDPANFELAFATPLETQVGNAADPDGSVPVWARVVDIDGDWWADLTVTVLGDGGDIQLPSTGVENGNPVVRWFNGSIARIATAKVQG